MAAVVPGEPDLAGLIRSARAAPCRHLAVAGTLNFRDVGGYLTRNGVTDGDLAALRAPLVTGGETDGAR